MFQVINGNTDQNNIKKITFIYIYTHTNFYDFLFNKYDRAKAPADSDSNSNAELCGAHKILYASICIEDYIHLDSTK